MSSAALSVVLPAESFADVQDVVKAWRAQGIADRLELVLVAPWHGARPGSADLEGFAGVTLVEVTGLLPTSVALTAGVQAASSDAVYLGETHAFPEPAAAAALLDRLAEGWVAAVPAVRNANPGLLSSAAFVSDYGRWAQGAAGELADLPAHNMACARSVLLSCGDELADLLDVPGGLAERLRSRGYRFCFEPGAVVRHFNVATPRSWVLERFVSGRSLATVGRQHFGPGRRLVYGLAAPLVLPPLLLARMRRDPVVSPQVPRFGRAAWLALVAGLTIWAVGEAAGYLLGPGKALLRRRQFEIHRLRHV